MRDTKGRQQQNHKEKQEKQTGEEKWKRVETTSSKQALSSTRVLPVKYLERIQTEKRDVRQER